VSIRNSLSIISTDTIYLQELARSFRLIKTC